MDDSEYYMNIDPEGKFIGLLFDRQEIEATIFKNTYRSAAQVRADEAART